MRTAPHPAACTASRHACCWASGRALSETRRLLLHWLSGYAPTPANAWADARAVCVPFGWFALLRGAHRGTLCTLLGRMAHLVVAGGSGRLPCTDLCAGTPAFAPHPFAQAMARLCDVDAVYMLSPSDNEQRSTGMDEMCITATDTTGTFHRK